MLGNMLAGTDDLRWRNPPGRHFKTPRMEISQRWKMWQAADTSKRKQSKRVPEGIEEGHRLQRFCGGYYLKWIGGCVLV